MPFCYQGLPPWWSRTWGWIPPSRRWCFFPCVSCRPGNCDLEQKKTRCHCKRCPNLQSIFSVKIGVLMNLPRYQCQQNVDRSPNMPKKLTCPILLCISYCTFWLDYLSTCQSSINFFNQHAKKALTLWVSLWIVSDCSCLIGIMLPSSCNWKEQLL